MTYQIVSVDREAEMTPQVEQEILGKIGKLDKFLARVPEENYFLRIRLSPNAPNPRWTDALLDLNVEGDVLIGTGSADTPVHAVHLATIELERQLEERKQRLKPYAS